MMNCAWDKIKIIMTKMSQNLCNLAIHIINVMNRHDDFIPRIVMMILHFIMMNSTLSWWIYFIMMNLYHQNRISKNRHDEIDLCHDEFISSWQILFHHDENEFIMMKLTVLICHESSWQKFIMTKFCIHRDESTFIMMNFILFMTNLKSSWQI